MRLTKFLLPCVAVLMSLGPPPAAADWEDDWQLELGAMIGHHSNFFFRGDGSPAPEEDLFTLYFTGERERKLDRGKLTLFFDAGAIQAAEINGADYYRLTLGGDYKLGATKFMGELFTTPNRVYFEEADGVFYDIAGVELGVRHGLRPGLWIGLEYEVEQLRFDAAARGRDATAQEIAASLRLPVGPRLGVRLTALIETRDAEEPQYDLTGSGFAVALEAQPHQRVNLFTRYKRREREYEDAPADARNFGRDDTVNDFILNVRWRVGQRWGVRLENFYRDGESTRPDRNFDGLLTSAGFFYLF